jgi:hypothetical protein
MTDSAASNKTGPVTDGTSPIDPIFDRGANYLMVDPERDGLSTHVNEIAHTVDADLYLTEGVALSGTHYGLNLISTSGVVLIDKNARVLPSKKRPSSIACQKLVNAGELVADRLQADVLVVLGDGSKTILGEAIWGTSFVTTERGLWRIQRSSRQLAAREPRVQTLYEEAIAVAKPEEENGFDAICRAQDAAIEAKYPAEPERPRLSVAG